MKNRTAEARVIDLLAAGSRSRPDIVEGVRRTFILGAAILALECFLSGCMPSGALEALDRQARLSMAKLGIPVYAPGTGHLGATQEGLPDGSVVPRFVYEVHTDVAPSVIVKWYVETLGRRGWGLISLRHYKPHSSYNPAIIPGPAPVFGTATDALIGHPRSRPRVIIKVSAENYGSVRDVLVNLTYYSGKALNDAAPS